MSEAPDRGAGEPLARAFLAAVTEALLYTVRHPRTEAASDRLAAASGSLAADTTLYLEEDQVVLAERPLPEVSLPARRTILLLQSRGLGGVTFRPGFGRADVLRLLETLTSAAAAKEGYEGLCAGMAGGSDRIGVHPPGVLKEGPGGTAASKPTGLLVTRRIYEDALGIVQGLLDDVGRGRRVNPERTQKIASDIAGSVLRDKGAWVTLTSLREYDEYTYTHCVNVCALGIALAEQFTRSFDLLVEFGQACLLHDVGKILVPREIVTSSAKLTRAEWEAMRSHPILGAKLLLSSEGVSRLSILVSFSHHLRHNRTGYPPLRGPLRANPFTEILHVVDVFDALTTNRGYRESWDTYKAVAFMLRGAGTEFDPAVLRTFTQLVGIYPAGTFVELDGGERGQVIRVHPDAVTRPAVRILVEPDGSPASPVREVDLRDADSEGKPVRKVLRPLSMQEVSRLGVGLPA